MATIRSFKDVNSVLQGYIPSARAMRANYSLDTMRALMDALGNPQDSYRVIHIAGTSGKTSTAYFTSALLVQAGVKVGLTVSPHVDAVNERLQINLTPLSEAAYCRAFQEFMQIVGATTLHPTYFELLVAFAFWQFAREGVDYAVVEVGLGGLLDGTNVVTRVDKIAVLTDVGLDHTDILGDTLPEIALQKAGILLAGNRVFCHDQPPEVVSVFKNYARHIGAELAIVDDVPVSLDSLALYQQRNWSLAYHVACFALARDDYATLTPKQLQASMQVYIPARMEQLTNGNTILVLDAAHNPQKMKALVASLQQRYPGERWVVLMALLHSKDQRLAGVLEQLLPITSQLFVTDFEAGQDLRKNSAKPEDIIAMCHERGFYDVVAEHNSEQAFLMLVDAPCQHKLATGSFYLLQEIHALTKKSAQPATK